MSETNELVIRDNKLVQYNGTGGNIVIPEGVRVINFYAFQWVKEITTIQLPSTLEEIGHEAFRNFRIKTVFPAGQQDVSDNMLILPAGIKTIESEAFYGTNFREIYIPDSIQLIERGAFGGCSNLEYLEIRGTPELNSIFADFLNRPYEGLLLLPDLVPGKISKTLRDMAVHSFCKAILDGKDFGPEAKENYTAFLKRTRKQICKAQADNKEVIEYMLREKLLDPEALDILLPNVQKLGDAEYLAKVTEYQNAIGGADEEAKQKRAQKKAEQAAKAKAKKEAEAQAAKDYDSLSLAERVKVKRKRSPQAQVELLEAVVLYGTLEDLENVYATCGSFEFTARALAYAARYRSAEMVEALVKHGATFDYEKTPAFEGKYHYTIHISNAYSTTRNYYLHILEAEKPRPEPANVTLQPAEERVKSLEVLHAHKKAVALPEDRLYYNAALYCELPMLDACKKLGIEKMPPYEIGRLCDSRQDGYDVYFRGQVSNIMGSAEPRKLRIVLEHLLAQLGEEKMKLLPGDLYNEHYRGGSFVKEFYRHYCEAGVFDLLLDHSNLLDRVGKWDILYGLADYGNADGLTRLLQLGWTLKPKDLEILLQYVQEKETDAPEFKAILLEKLNALPAAKKKEELSLSANPFSVAEMKKIWSYKKQEDGTLILTSYKGEALDVVIPSVIGKSTVTALESGLFYPEVSNLSPAQKKARENIASVDIPGTIRVIPHNLFSTNQNGGRTALKRVTLGSGVKELDHDAFSYCTGLEELILPDTLEAIGKQAFYGCSSLKNLEIPKGVTKLEAYVFAGCGFESFTVPDQIRTLGMGVFQRCSNLKTVKLPDGIREIPTGMFAETGLETYAIPESVVAVHPNAFLGCRHLKSVEIPERVSVIEQSVFARCEALEEFTVPAHVTLIKDRAFVYCENLKRFAVKNLDTQIADTAFVGCTSMADDRGLVIFGDTVYDYILPERTKPLEIPREIKNMNVKLLMPRLPFITWQGEVGEMPPMPPVADLSKGEEVFLGRFPQNGVELQPLPWVVLAKEEGRVLLLAKEIIASLECDYMCKKILQKETWETAEIRTWLNDVFLNTVFSPEEQQYIAQVTLTNPNNKKHHKKGGPDTEDRVFLLSVEEVLQYIPEERERRCGCTNYANIQRQRADRSPVWMTRTPGNGSWGKPAAVDGWGDINYAGNSSGDYALRPAIWIKEKD